MNQGTPRSCLRHAGKGEWQGAASWIISGHLGSGCPAPDSSDSRYEELNPLSSRVRRPESIRKSNRRAGLQPTHFYNEPRLRG